MWCRLRGAGQFIEAPVRRHNAMSQSAAQDALRRPLPWLENKLKIIDRLRLHFRGDAAACVIVVVDRDSGLHWWWRRWPIIICGDRRSGRLHFFPRIDRNAVESHQRTVTSGVGLQGESSVGADDSRRPPAHRSSRTIWDEGYPSGRERLSLKKHDAPRLGQRGPIVFATADGDDSDGHGNNHQPRSATVLCQLHPRRSWRDFATR
jgi:hypothetical protein